MGFETVEGVVADGRICSKQLEMEDMELPDDAKLIFFGRTGKEDVPIEIE